MKCIACSQHEIGNNFDLYAAWMLVLVSIFYHYVCIIVQCAMCNELFSCWQNLNKIWTKLPCAFGLNVPFIWLFLCANEWYPIAFLIGIWMDCCIHPLKWWTIIYSLFCIWNCEFHRANQTYCLNAVISITIRSHHQMFARNCQCKYALIMILLCLTKNSIASMYNGELVCLLLVCLHIFL